MTTRAVLLPQGVPIATTTHAPSNLAGATAAFSRRAARFVRLGLAASRALRIRSRVNRTAIFHHCDAAARAAGLRMGKAGPVGTDRANNATRFARHGGLAARGAPEVMRSAMPS
jgi:hypothetical protein